MKTLSNKKNYITKVLQEIVQTCYPRKHKNHQKPGFYPSTKILSRSMQNDDLRLNLLSNRPILAYGRKSNSIKLLRLPIMKICKIKLLDTNLQCGKVKCYIAKRQNVFFSLVTHDFNSSFMHTKTLEFHKLPNYDQFIKMLCTSKLH